MYKINRVSDSELKCRNYGELTFGRKQIRCCATAASRCYILTPIFGRITFSFDDIRSDLCSLRVCFYGGAFLCPKFKEETAINRF